MNKKYNEFRKLNLNFKKVLELNMKLFRFWKKNMKRRFLKHICNKLNTYLNRVEKAILTNSKKTFNTEKKSQECQTYLIEKKQSTMMTKFCIQVKNNLETIVNLISIKICVIKN